jgi:hypothetical protein
VSGRELPNVAEDRVRPRDRVEGEKRLERVEVDLAARQRPKLRGEGELVRAEAVVERLDPERITGEHEPSLPGVPECDGEHAAQALREPVAVLLVEVHQHLGVGAGRKAVAGDLQPRTKLAVVVDLSVLDDVDRAVLVRDRLVARLEVDDREPAGRKPGRTVDDLTVGVRPAVDERGAHRAQALGVDRAAA